MNPNILFLDDDVKILKSIKRFLKKYSNDWNVHFATTYAEAIPLLKDSSIDLALLDINLPGKNGFDLLEHIKTTPEYQDIETVMITGMDESDLKRKALKRGASDLLHKPIEAEDLIARIQATLKSKFYKDQLAEKNKILEQKLIAAQKMEITGVLATGVIHDIRNIFIIIQNYPYIIKNKLKSNISIDTELEKIQKASDNAENILRQILTFAKSDTIENYEVDLNKITKETISLLKPSIPENIEIKTSLTSNPVTGVYNKTQLVQILMNLIINAKDAVGNTGIINIKTWQETNNNQKFNSFHISDNGKGMPASEVEKIFNNRYSKKDSNNNFGFGLPVVKLLVEMNNGTIMVNSERNKGTTFTIRLPMGKN